MGTHRCIGGGGAPGGEKCSRGDGGARHVVDGGPLADRALRCRSSFDYTRVTALFYYIGTRV